MIRHVLAACSVAAVISSAALAQSAKPQPRQTAPQQERAAPQQQEQQQVSSTPFDSWVKRCVNQQDASDKTVKTCEVRSHLVIQDKESDKQVVAAVVVVVRAMNAKTMQAVVQVPTSARLSVMPKLYGADNNKPLVELPFFACQPQLCTAIANLSDAQIASMKKVSDKITVAYDNQAGQTVRIEGQAKGLAAALDSLIKEK